ncbi:MAG: hypothetical protein HQL20_11560 [Candidatus Omnitrophica bacterium]|nr:hypothetical protein [Candidatus Omnitrophota bacterium]
MINSWERGRFGKRIVSGVMALVIALGAAGPSEAQHAVLPAPGSMMPLSAAFAPPLLKGIRVYRNDPFRFDFILDQGDPKEARPGLISGSRSLSAARMLKYFLASLTVPEKDLWVNLSPYEKDRIVPEAFGQTEMGRDLLAQDYILKQVTASVIYPESKVGREFWGKVYAEAQKRYGTTDIPVDTFNKVWILPEKATVYENKDAAFVVESRLKVMLEKDYLATQVSTPTPNDPDNIARNVLREIVIPVLEKEVNEGGNFALLRQVYHSLILATWYKRKVRAGILGRAYVDRRKTAGIDIADKNEKEKVWEQYVEAFRKGAYSLIREEYDPATRQAVPRQYFSGGTDLAMGAVFRVTDSAELPDIGSAQIVRMRVDPSMSRAVDVQTAGRSGKTGVVADMGMNVPLPQESGKLYLSSEEVKALVDPMEEYLRQQSREIVLIDIFNRDEALIRQYLRDGKIIKLDFRGMDKLPEKDPWGETPLGHISRAFEDFAWIYEQAVAQQIGFRARDHLSVTGELLKNAFRHGSKLDHGLPVYIYADVGQRKIEVYNLSKVVDEDSRDWQLLRYKSMMAMLGGAGMGLRIIKDDGLLYDRMEVKVAERVIGVRATVTKDGAMNDPGGIDLKLAKVEQKTQDNHTCPVKKGEPHPSC